MNGLKYYLLQLKDWYIEDPLLTMEGLQAVRAPQQPLGGQLHRL